MEFRILGPLEVCDDGRAIDVGGPRQRALLAILLLYANEVVSRDRLIYELWGETPPAAAVKTLQAYVSRLRRALQAGGRAAERLETHGRGYRLRVEPGELDADRFQQLLAQAREELARHDASRAADVLRQALSLWRGPALGEFAYDSFSQSEIARLEELRLTALEERGEAELALGRHATLIAELESLVARHPLRERLRGQLMLALYRSGRQAGALETYHHGRRALLGELGLEPGQALQQLERRILEQDPALAPPEPALPHRERISRRGRSLGLLAAALTVAVIAATVLGPLGAERATRADRGLDADVGPSASALDARTGALRSRAPLGTAPSTIVVGEGAVWVLDADDQTVSRIDPDSGRRTRSFGTGSTPTDIAVGAGALWIGNAVRSSRDAGTNYPRSVSRLDPASGVLEATITLPRRADGNYFQGGGFSQQHLAATDSALWVVNPDQTVSRIDPRTNRRVAVIEGVRARDVAAGDGSVWVSTDGAVAEIDPRANALARTIEVAARSGSALAVGAGSVWMADPLGGSVWRIEPDPKALLRQIPLDVGVRSVAFGQGALWATNEVANKVYRIDPATNHARVVNRLVAPQSVAVGETAVWVSALGTPPDLRSLPAATCPHSYSGVADPQLRLVSDLPLQGPARAESLPMVEAIRFVLERRGFRAGRYTVGYQSCDDSTAQAGGTDIYRCFGNAKAYARDRDVIGVIGPYHSYCAAVQIPIANQAPGGPLAIISPSNTHAGLTRPYPHMRDGELELMYPTGVRNYVRVAAADHLAAIAQVEVARALDVTSVFPLWDGDDAYAGGFASAVRKAARERGLELAGAATWRPDARHFARLARTIARTKPAAVLLIGAAPPHQGALIRDLRAGLGPRVELIAMDGFSGFDNLIAAAGPAARGMSVISYGIPNRFLPAAGRRFLRAFQTSRRGQPTPNLSVTYAAQTAEILLDAIARSDGTRLSVARELRRTIVNDGIVGDIHFDKYGDLIDAPFTVFRITRKHAIADHVITVRAGPGTSNDGRRPSTP